MAVAVAVVAVAGTALLAVFVVAVGVTFVALATPTTAAARRRCPGHGRRAAGRRLPPPPKQRQREASAGGRQARPGPPHQPQLPLWQPRGRHQGGGAAGAGHRQSGHFFDPQCAKCGKGRGLRGAWRGGPRGRRAEGGRPSGLLSGGHRGAPIPHALPRKQMRGCTGNARAPADAPTHVRKLTRRVHCSPARRTEGRAARLACAPACTEGVCVAFVCTPRTKKKRVLTEEAEACTPHSLPHSLPPLGTEPKNPTQWLSPSAPPRPGRRPPAGPRPSRPRPALWPPSAGRASRRRRRPACRLRLVHCCRLASPCWCTPRPTRWRGEGGGSTFSAACARAHPRCWPMPGWRAREKGVVRGRGAWGKK